jgi:cephalosporin-C deacetylase-like acetyl esterase
MLVVVVSLLPPSMVAQISSPESAKHFTDDASALLDIKEISVQDRDGVMIHDITYVGSNGDTVPAYLVVPAGKGKFAAIVWGHWLMPNSSTSNRAEFLQEAIVLAPAGVVSLLIDAPQARPGFKPAPNPVVVAQQVMDLRRGVDLLLSRSDIDPKRVAYVGHSWDAGTGAILDAVDKRFAAFVFMSGPQSTRQYVLLSDSSRMVAARKGADMAKIEQVMQANAWADPATYASQLGPAPALFQYGLRDEEWVPLADAKDYFAMSSGAKQVKFYDSDHALNAQARLDRYNFLRTNLAFNRVPPSSLTSIPPTK